MRIHPVGMSSLLVTRQSFQLCTPRILRTGVAQSLLAERLQRRSSLACRFHCPQQPRRGFDSTPPPVSVAPEPIDRDWPSERKVDEVTVVVEDIRPIRLDSAVGGFLDILW